MPPQSDDKRQAAREVIDILHEISTLLVCSSFPPFFNMAVKIHASQMQWFANSFDTQEHEPGSN